MTNKPQKSWSEIRLAIAAVALTATIGIWNLLAAGQKQQVTVSATDTDLPPAEDIQAIVATATPQFLPVKIIFGGNAPQQQVVVQASAPQTVRKSSHRPPASTGSSKP